MRERVNLTVFQFYYRWKICRWIIVTFELIKTDYSKSTWLWIWALRTSVRTVFLKILSFAPWKNWEFLTFGITLGLYWYLGLIMNGNDLFVVFIKEDCIFNGCGGKLRRPNRKLQKEWLTWSRAHSKNKILIYLEKVSSINF